MFKRILSSSLILLATPALAQDDAETSPWSGETSLGYSKESGNTNETNVNFSQKLVYDAKPWLNTLTLSGKGSKTENITEDADGNEISSEDETTDEAYYITEQLDYFFGDSPSYSFARATWEKDRFNGYDHQITGVLGYGNEIIANDAVNLKLEIGVGIRSDELSDPLTTSDGETRMAGDKNDEEIIYLSDQFVWTLSEGAEFGQSLNIEYADVNTVSRFDVYLKAQLISSIAMKLSYEIKHQEVVADDSEKTDKIFLASLLYSF